MAEELTAEEMAQPVRMSYLEFLFQALGFRYTVLLPAVGLLAFVFVLVLVIRGKGPALTGALLFLVPLPVLLGVFAAIDGMLASFQVIAMSNTAPKPSEYAMGISMSVVSVYLGFLLALPSFVLATCGLVARALFHRPSTVERPLPDSPLPAKLV